MNTWSIGEVEEITGVKTHILRYWEEVIPSFAPKKDIGGRRIYTPHDIQTVMRLKYLIQDKKFTIEGARDQLITETAEINSVSDISPDSPLAFQAEQLKRSKAETLQVMTELRTSLLDLYVILRKYRTPKEEQ